MTTHEIGLLIQEHYKFIKVIPDAEVLVILQQITAQTTDDELDEIVYSTVSDRISMMLESVDMSASSSILAQIKAKLEDNDT